MKRYTSLILILGFAGGLHGQEYAVRVAPVQFHTINQDGITLSGTYNEPLVSSGVKEDVILVTGFYPGILADSVTRVYDEVPVIEDLIAYPNPVSNSTTLELQRSHGTLDIHIYNLDGQLLDQVLWLEDTPAVELTFACRASANYFIVVTDPILNARTVIRLTKH